MRDDMKIQKNNTISSTTFKILHAVIGILLASALISNTTMAAQMYKWVDEDGNISYQDSPPPEGSNIIKEEALEGSSGNSNTSSEESGNNAVIAYTVDDCEACDLLKTRLNALQVPFTEQSLQDRDVQTRILELGDSLRAPTLFIGDKMITNVSSNNLISELQQAGYELDIIENDPDYIPPTESEETAE